MYAIRKNVKRLSVIRGLIYDLPVPLNLRKMWNFGSLLGLCLLIQIITGIIIRVHYSARTRDAFRSVVHIMRDVNEGWVVRATHANGASFFFIMIYLHIARGLFFFSFHSKAAWLIGVVIFFILIMVAFTGYVLPWGQISFWGATVITNLLTAVPWVGRMLVEWVWGGIRVGDPTLKRFYTFHFLFPFVLVGLAFFHILLIHEVGASNPLGLNRGGDMVIFHPYYRVKDLLGVRIFLCSLGLCVCLRPDFFLDPLNFSPADRYKTPIHIQPEWYFLFAYSILRRVPRKVGGVLALFLSVIILAILPLYPKSVFKGIQSNLLRRLLFFFFVGDFILLTFLGTCPVERPFLGVGMVATVGYFLFFILYPIRWFVYESLLFKKDEE